MSLHPDFVYLQDILPEVLQEPAYATMHNFTGHMVPGYMRQTIILSKPLAARVQQAHTYAVKHQLNFKVFDSYRPQQAVDAFVSWVNDLDDQQTKSVYYPHLAKADILAYQYIYARSTHTRGAAIDLTLVDTHGQELDMGTIFDFFDETSHTHHPHISDVARRNRDLLSEIMHHGALVNYPKEWWHFNFPPDQEPFPDTYFNFPVQ